MTASNTPITHRKSVIFLLLATACLWLLAFGCKVSQNERIIRLPGNKKAHLLDTSRARSAIIKDEQENFFELVNPMDISIQTKVVLDKDIDRETLLQNYKSFLQSEVMDFTPEDARRLEAVMKQVGRLAHQFSPDLLPKNLYLIKVKGQQYGPQVYYTRKNCIVIPAAELENASRDLLRNVLLHELFHIYSRYYPDKKHQLYELIGFRPLPIHSSELQIPEQLQTSILLNPDGINFAYAIELEDQAGQKHTCIPIISSDFHQFSSNSYKGYLSYLSFNLYPIAETDGQYTVLTEADGSSPLKPWDIRESFYSQIGRSTDYVIHPDEILADNFVLMVLRQTPGTREAQRFATTKPLWQEMEEIIRLGGE